MQHKHYFLAYLLPLLLSLSLASCLTYYQRNLQFYQSFETGKFQAAKQTLLNDKKGAKRNTRLLHFLNLGIVHSMLGEYQVSNQYFEKAYTLGEDYRTNYLKEALSFLSNPSVTEYKGEDWELLLLHYYKALNYMKMQDPDKALVECRRMDIKLRAFGNRYNSPNKYQKDAFINLLMGIIYDAKQDYNNAFIAYRNALNIYEEDYQRLFDMSPPEQLKDDLMRCAYLMNFEEELRYYEKKFGREYVPNPKGNGNLVFLWHNGLGPIKSQWSIDFQINTFERDERAVFVNDRMDLNFEFPLEYYEDENEERHHRLEGLSRFRVAFPRYIERETYFSGASLDWQGRQYPLEISENLAKIARKTLQQRMIKEFSEGLMRFALKKAQEIALRKNDKPGLASLLSIVNAASEQADTRGWQSVPNSIYYVRLNLPPGKQALKFLPEKKTGGHLQYDFNFDIPKNGTVFHTFHSLEVDPKFHRSFAEQR